MNCYLIAIGGTGARCIESLVQLCAAGLGPPKLRILIIDPDSANGNFTHSKGLIDSYKECHNFLKGGKSGIFQTEISPAKIPGLSNPFHWSPLTKIKTADPDNIPNLKNIFNYSLLDDNLKDLCNMLYSDDELKVDLNEGFLGHPNIGAPVLGGIKLELDDEPLKSFIDSVRDDLNNGRTTGIFIVASIFGGTGAAGFPVIGRILRDLSEENTWSNKDHLHIGGALVLPYFTYSIKKDADNVYARPENFLTNTKAALLHYSSMKAFNPVGSSFDSIYYLGENEYAKMDFSSGGQNQLNPAHHIDLLSSISVNHFFESLKHGQPRSGKTIHHFLGRENKNTVSWRDIPSSLRNDYRKHLLYFYTFAIAALTFYLPLLDTVKNNRRKEYTIPWYIDHFRPKDLFRDSDQPKLKALSSLLEESLTWLYNIHENDDIRVLLFNSAALKDLKKSRFSFPNDIYLRNLLSDKLGVNKFGYDSFWNEMCGFKNDYKNAHHDPVDRLVTMIYDSAKEYCKKNYEFER